MKRLSEREASFCFAITLLAKGNSIIIDIIQNNLFISEKMFIFVVELNDSNQICEEN